MDSGLFLVKLIGDFADELLDQIFQGDESSRRAELIDDHCQVETMLLHLAHRGAETLGLGQELH